MDTVHPILAAVLQRTEKSLWPSELHRGAAPPRVTRHVLLPLAVLVLELLDWLGTSDLAREAAELSVALRDADTVAARYSASTMIWDFAMHRNLHGPQEWSGLPVESQLIARSVWLVTRHEARKEDDWLDLESDAARWALQSFEQVLGSFPISAGRRRDFVADVDHWLLIDEAERLTGRADVRSVLWRHPAADDRTHLVGTLYDGTHYVVTQVADAWPLELGGLDDVLSVLGEDLLEEASARIY